MHWTTLIRSWATGMFVEKFGTEIVINMAFERLNRRSASILLEHPTKIRIGHHSDANSQDTKKIIYLDILLEVQNAEITTNRNDIIRNNNVHNTQIELFRLIDFADILSSRGTRNNTCCFIQVSIHISEAIFNSNEFFARQQFCWCCCCFIWN